MKKLFFAVGAFAFAFANAAPQRLVSIQVAETSALVAGVSKIGEMAGNPMIAAMLAPQIAQNPLAEFFGPARAGEAIGISLWGDSGALKSLIENGDFPDGVYVAYPVKRTKAEFIAAHAGAAETNGVISVEGYAVVFSDDGRWAVATADASRAMAGLSEVAIAQRPLKGDIVRIEVSKEAFPQLLAMIDGNKEAQELVEGYDSALLALCIGEKSIDIKIAADAKKGSLLDKIGQTSLAGDYFAFAPDDAIVAQNEAKDGRCYGSGVKQFESFLDLVRSFGIKTDFIATDKKQPGVYRYTFDIKKAYAYFSGEEGRKACEKVDPEAFLAGYSKITADCAVASTSPAEAVSFTLKGIKPKKPLARLFADTVPEAAGKKPFAVSCWSLYAIFRGMAAELVPGLPAELRMQIEPVMMTLPPAEDCAIASYACRNGMKHEGLMRISAGELKGLGAVVNSIAGFVMSCSSCGGCDDDEIIEEECESED